MTFNQFCIKRRIFYLVKLPFFVTYFPENEGRNSIAREVHLLFFIEGRWLISTLRLLCAIRLPSEKEMVIGCTIMILKQNPYEDS